MTRTQLTFFAIKLGKNRDKTKNIHMYCCWRSSYQGRGWTIITGLIPPHVCACSKPWRGFPASYVVVFFLCSVRDDCLFCWFWWNCLPSLFEHFLIINRRCKFCTYSLPLTKTTCYHKINDNINMNSTIVNSGVNEC